jgi:hypothetical protein
MAISSPITNHVRRDKGVIIEYQLHMQNNIFIVEKFRNKFHCSVCAVQACKHTRLARQLEEAHQSNLKPDPTLGSCYYCGSLAKKINGIAVCLSCNS